MQLSKQKFDAIIKIQMIYWLASIFFSTCLALFAKLIWTAKFPILIFMPMMLVGFALGSIGQVRQALTPFIDEETASDKQA